MTTIDILKKTRAARGGLAVLDEAGKNALLLSMADSLLSHEGAILAENEADMSDARGHISDVMLDRLRLDHDRLAGMADGVRAIAALPEREQLVMALYYEEELNLREIGQILGVTESRVCQLHSQAISRIRSRVFGEAATKARGRRKSEG